MKLFPCIESTLDIEDRPTGRIVRLWINRNDIPKGEANLFGDLTAEIKQKLVYNMADDELIKWLAKIPNVNAIQIINSDKYYFGTDFGVVKYGTVVYTVPFEDVHG